MIPQGLFNAVNKILLKSIGYQIVSNVFVEDMKVLLIKDVMEKLLERDKEWLIDTENLKREWMERIYTEDKETDTD